MLKALVFVVPKTSAPSTHLESTVVLSKPLVSDRANLHLPLLRGNPYPAAIEPIFESLRLANLERELSNVDVISW